MEIKDKNITCGYGAINIFNGKSVDVSVGASAQPHVKKYNVICLYWDVFDISIISSNQNFIDIIQKYCEENNEKKIIIEVNKFLCDHFSKNHSKFKKYTEELFNHGFEAGYNKKAKEVSNMLKKLIVNY